MCLCFAFDLRESDVKSELNFVFHFNVYEIVVGSFFMLCVFLEESWLCVHNLYSNADKRCQGLFAFSSFFVFCLCFCSSLIEYDAFFFFLFVVCFCFQNIFKFCS